MELARSTISTHILDTGTGAPRAGAAVRLWRLRPGNAPAMLVTGATTDADGRVSDLLGGETLEEGAYALEFVLEDGFFTTLTIEIRIDDPARSYHVPLLVAPYGLSTYRGS